MEFKFAINDTHTRPVLCITINHSRREIFTGSEDSTIKVWEYDTGRLVHTLSAHKGYVTSLVYCKDLKILLSTSIDGSIIAWGPGGKLIQTIQTKSPIYSAAFNPRKYQLMVGNPGKVCLYRMNTTEEQITANNIIDHSPYHADYHSDLVRNILCVDGKFVSAGYDKKIVIYNAPHHTYKIIKASRIVEKAHESGITAMTHGRDAENSWIITTSFDKIIKIWSLDGALIHRFEGFSETITSMAFNGITNTLWITASSPTPIIYDPRAGINITEFMSTKQEIDPKITKTNSHGIISYLYTIDGDEMIAITTRRHVFIWKHSLSSPVSVLNGHLDTVESLAVTTKEPLYIFSGGGDGNINRWEPFQLNTMIFTRTDLTNMINDESSNRIENKRQASTDSENPESSVILPGSAHIYNYDARRKQQIELHKKLRNQLMIWHGRWSQINKDPGGGKESWSRILSRQVKLMSNSTMEDFKMKERQLVLKAKRIGLHLDNSYGQELALDDKNSIGRILKMVYYEELDFLIASTDIGMIYVYSYGQIEVETDKATGEFNENPSKIEVSGKMANMACKYKFGGHRGGVSAITCFKFNDKNFMLSGGWDRRLIIWDLDCGKICDVLRNDDDTNEVSLPQETADSLPDYPSQRRKTTKNQNNANVCRDQFAADGIILDMDFSKEYKIFAYSSGDRSIYLRKFPDTGKGNEMNLIAVMQGHENDVTCIRWNRIISSWISASEDCTIRVWSWDGIKCLNVFDNEAPVYCLVVDSMNGCLVSGAQDGLVRVFDPFKEPNQALCQRLNGHQHAVRSIVHLEDRNQYLSASWDHSIHVWKAYFRKGQLRKRSKSNKYESNQTQIEEDGNPPESVDPNKITGVQTNISKNGCIMMRKLAHSIDGTANEIRNILKGLSEKSKADAAQEREMKARQSVDDEMDRVLTDLEHALQQQTCGGIITGAPSSSALFAEKVAGNTKHLRAQISSQKFQNIFN